MPAITDVHILNIHKNWQTAEEFIRKTALVWDGHTKGNFYCVYQIGTVLYHVYSRSVETLLTNPNINGIRFNDFYYNDNIIPSKEVDSWVRSRLKERSNPTKDTLTTKKEVDTPVKPEVSCETCTFNFNRLLLLCSNPL